jgi:hypothetical protein
VTGKIENTFDSIEGAHELVTLLSASVTQARREIEADLARNQVLPVSRRLVARLPADTDAVAATGA